jgi:hypothetical protein
VTWWDEYQIRRGTSRRDSLADTNKNLINREFENATTYEEVYINNSHEKTGVRIVEENSLQKNPNRKRMLMQPSDIITVGSTVLWNDNYWLVTDLDTDYFVYYVGIIEKCNNTFTIKTGATDTVKGYDSMGRPIVESVPSYTSFPCIEISSLNVNRRTNLNEPVNLPFGRSIITIPYSNKLKMNMEFIMSANKYKIIDISLSRIGLVDFMADKIV